MKIRLEDNYMIVDGNGISYDVVRENPKKLDKKGEPTVRAISYHSTVAQALESYARLVASTEIRGEITLKQYLEQYNAIVDRIYKLAETGPNE